MLHIAKCTKCDVSGETVDRQAAITSQKGAQNDVAWAVCFDINYVIRGKQDIASYM